MDQNRHIRDFDNYSESSGVADDYDKLASNLKKFNPEMFTEAQ